MVMVEVRGKRCVVGQLGDERGGKNWSVDVVCGGAVVGWVGERWWVVGGKRKEGMRPNVWVFASYELSLDHQLDF